MKKMYEAKMDNQKESNMTVSHAYLTKSALPKATVKQ